MTNASVAPDGCSLPRGSAVLPKSRLRWYSPRPIRRRARSGGLADARARLRRLRGLWLVAALLGRGRLRRLPLCRGALLRVLHVFVVARGGAGLVLRGRLDGLLEQRHDVDHALGLGVDLRGGRLVQDLGLAAL